MSYEKKFKVTYNVIIGCANEMYEGPVCDYKEEIIEAESRLDVIDMYAGEVGDSIRNFTCTEI